MQGLNSKKGDCSLFFTALRASLPVLAGYGLLGTAYGILMRQAGFSVVFAVAMSLFVYAGSLQFAAIGLLTGGASLLTVALTSLTVNARHLFYGLSMGEKYQSAGVWKPYMVLSLTDETYSLAVAPRPLLSTEEELRLCRYVSLLDHLYWVGGTALGALAYALIPIPTGGLDFALTALFLTVFIDQWRDGNGGHGAALTGLTVTLVCRLLFGSGSFLIPTVILMLPALLLNERTEAKIAEKRATAGPDKGGNRHA